MADETTPELSKLEVEVDESSPLIVPEVKDEDIIPTFHSPQWSEYVLKQFEADEMIDGNPTVDGLRRLTGKLLGDIVESTCRVIVAPSMGDMWGAATVEHNIVIETPTGKFLRFCEVADVNGQNTDLEFSRFASSTASTRAEARALRKALRLKRTVAAEEVTSIEPDKETAPGQITKNQLNFLVNLCKRNDIDIKKYVNSGKTQYAKLEDIPYAIGVKMVGVLSEYQRNTKKIPDGIKGWDEDWNKS